MEQMKKHACTSGQTQVPGIRHDWDYYLSRAFLADGRRLFVGVCGCMGLYYMR